MKAEDLTKFTRWLIPGWIFFLTFAIFIVVDLSFHSSGWAQFQEQIQQLLRQFGAILASIIIVLAGIPFGFLIYQIYFFFRWNSPFRGYAVSYPWEPLSEAFSFWIFSDRDFDFGESWRKSVIENYRSFPDPRFLYKYQEAFFLEVCQYLDSSTGGPSFYERYRYLHEVTHTLGASIVAVVLAFFTYTITRLYFEFNASPFFYIFVSFTITVIFLTLLHTEYSRKKKGDCTHLSHLQNGFCYKDICFSHTPSQFVFGLWTFNIFLNPSFSANIAMVWEIILRLFFIGLVIVTWYYSIIELPKDCKKGTFVLWSIILILSTVFYYLLYGIFPDSFANMIDWPFYTSLVVFLSLMLVLFVNRRNATNDKLNIELYVTKLYSSKNSTN